MSEIKVGDEIYVKGSVISTNNEYGRTQINLINNEHVYISSKCVHVLDALPIVVELREEIERLDVLLSHKPSKNWTAAYSPLITYLDNRGEGKDKFHVQDALRVLQQQDVTIADQESEIKKLKRVIDESKHENGHFLDAAIISEVYKAQAEIDRLQSENQELREQKEKQKDVFPKWCKWYCDYNKNDQRHIQYIQWHDTEKYTCYLADGTECEDKDIPWRYPSEESSNWLPVPAEPDICREKRELKDADKYRWYLSEHGNIRRYGNSDANIGFDKDQTWETTCSESDSVNGKQISAQQAIAQIRAWGHDPFIQLPKEESAETIPAEEAPPTSLEGFAIYLQNQLRYIAAKIKDLQEKANQ